MLRLVLHLPAAVLVTLAALAVAAGSGCRNTSTGPSPNAGPSPGEPSITLSPSVVRVGTDLTITGRGFPAGTAAKILRDPTDREVYNITFVIDVTGTFTATLYIPGPTGTWLLIIRYAGGELRVPFVVQN